jgi:hypothetical protein
MSPSTDSRNCKITSFPFFEAFHRLLEIKDFFALALRPAFFFGWSNSAKWKRRKEDQKHSRSGTNIGLSRDDYHIHPPSLRLELACGVELARPRFPCDRNTRSMKGIASERSASSRILRIWPALGYGQHICMSLISGHERYVSIGFVCEPD